MKITEIIEEFETKRWLTDGLGNRERLPVVMLRKRIVNKVSSIIRFGNYIIDAFVLILLGMLIIAGLEKFNILKDSSFYFQLIIDWGQLCFFLCYYPLMEHFYGQTLGKMVTGCHVINEYAEKPKLFSCFLRTIIRCVPFDVISILFEGDNRFWHDKWAKTWVVSTRERDELQSLLKNKVD